MFSSQNCATTPIIKKTYYLDFDCQTGDQDKNWAPTHMLQYLCSKPLKLVESQKTKNAFCHTNDMDRVEGSR